jgi:endonuclease IV
MSLTTIYGIAKESKVISVAVNDAIQQRRSNSQFPNGKRKGKANTHYVIQFGIILSDVDSVLCATDINGIPIISSTMNVTDAAILKSLQQTVIETGIVYACL